MRKLVGPTDDADFDNPTGALVYPWIAPDDYRSVFDFGSGCGRVARQLMLQDPVPERYVGIDPHAGMVAWCQRELTPCAPSFRFEHHDVYQQFMNPGSDKPRVLPFPVDDHDVTLVLAISVFTHLVEYQAVHYLDEVARVLRDDGGFVASWFLFDKRAFPVLQPYMNALFVSDVDPAYAVIYDRQWLLDTTGKLGLRLTRVVPPAIRGFQWLLTFHPEGRGTPEVDLPLDDAQFGTWEPPRLDTSDVSGIGLDGA
jgi:SAM-dependent methyltransferase